MHLQRVLQRVHALSSTVDIAHATLDDLDEAGLTVSFTITALADTEVIVDYVLHYQGKGGRITGRKVYRLKRVRLIRGDRITLSKRHLLRANMTTREIPPGRHELEIRLNGLSQRRCSLSVTS